MWREVFMRLKILKIIKRFEVVWDLRVFFMDILNFISYKVLFVFKIYV